MRNKNMTSIFKRIKNFLFKLFNKSETLLLDSRKDDNIIGNNTIYELKKENEILSIQREYEKGIIKEESLTNNEKEELIALYKKQIKTLEENIINQKNKLISYKINIRKKLNNI